MACRPTTATKLGRMRVCASRGACGDLQLIQLQLPWKVFSVGFEASFAAQKLGWTVVSPTGAEGGPVRAPSYNGCHPRPNKCFMSLIIHRITRAHEDQGNAASLHRLRQCQPGASRERMAGRERGPPANWTAATRLSPVHHCPAHRNRAASSRLWQWAQKRQPSRSVSSSVFENHMMHSGSAQCCSPNTCASKHTVGRRWGMCKGKHVQGHRHGCWCELEQEQGVGTRGYQRRHCRQGERAAIRVAGRHGGGQWDNSWLVP